MTDQWIETKLRALYGSVLDEPIPEELLRLLDKGWPEPVEADRKASPDQAKDSA